MELISYALTHTSNYGEKRKSPPQLIILHGSGLPEGATADNEVAYLQRPGVGVSYSYYVSKDGRVFQLVPDSAVAWHAGKSEWAEGETFWNGLNAYSIGIGLESHNKNDEVYGEKQLEVTRWLVQGLMIRYEIPAQRVLTHREISAPRKIDPVGWNIDAFRASL